MLWVFAACVVEPDPPSPSGDSAVDSAPVDSDPPPQDSATTDPFCADAPTLAWANFGEGFMRESCQGCHASTAPDRHDAPEDVTFDTAEQCWAWAEEILETATGADPTMPPRGGVTDDDRTRLEWWLRCGVPGT